MELEGLDGKGDVIDRSENARCGGRQSLAVHHRYVVAGCFWCIKCAGGTVFFWFDEVCWLRSLLGRVKQLKWIFLTFV